MYDLSILVEFGRPRAWYIDGPRREPVRLGDWVGDVNQGGGVNFFDVHFNPHAHGLTRSRSVMSCAKRAMRSTSEFRHGSALGWFEFLLRSY